LRGDVDDRSDDGGLLAIHDPGGMDFHRDFTAVLSQGSRGVVLGYCLASEALLEARGDDLARGRSDDGTELGADELFGFISEHLVLRRIQVCEAHVLQNENTDEGLLDESAEERLGREPRALFGLSVRDIGNHRQRTDARAAGAEQRAGRENRPRGRTVFFEHRRFGARGGVGVKRFADELVDVSWEKVDYGAPEKFIGGIAEELQKTSVDECGAVFEIAGPDPFLRRLDDLAVAVLALAQGFKSAFALGRIADSTCEHVGVDFTFDEIVHRAALERGDCGVFVADAGDHDDGHVRRGFARDAKGVQTLRIRKIEVEENCVERRSGEQWRPSARLSVDSMSARPSLRRRSCSMSAASVGES
jgi:hypothetical protein